MKKTILAVLAGVALVVAGCVSNITEPVPGKPPAYQDRVVKRYDRPLEEVFAAAKRALVSYGHITKEASMSLGTNQVRTIAGAVNQNKVWLRLEEVTPAATSVTIQIRAGMGGTDMQLAGDLFQRITVELPK